MNHDGVVEERAVRSSSLTHHIGGVDGAFDLGCKSASKRNEKSLFCPTSSNNDNINKRKRRVQATFIMQYFNRAKTLGEIFDALAKSVKHSSISSSSSFTRSDSVTNSTSLNKITLMPTPHAMMAGRRCSQHAPASTTHRAAPPRDASSPDRDGERRLLSAGDTRLQAQLCSD